MKQLVALIVILLAVINTQAQSPDSTLAITMATGAVYTGKVVENVPGEYVKIQGADKRITRIPYSMMKYLLNGKGDTLFVNIAPVVAEQVAHTKVAYVPPDALFTQLEEYKDWNRLILIDGKDTTYVKALPRDYSEPTRNIFGGYDITTVNKQGKKRKIDQEDLAEVISYDTYGDSTRYITLQDEYRLANFFRVIVEDKCQLLYNQTIVNNTVMVNDGLPGSVPTAMNVGVSYMENYYVYYKGELTLIHESPIRVFGSFKNRARDTFADCPEVVNKINNKVYTASDLKRIVTEFNKCIK